MNPPPTFEDVCKEIVQFRELVGRGLAGMEECPAKQQVRRLAEFMDKKFAVFKEAYPKAMTSLDEEIAGVQESVQKTLAQVDALKAKLVEQEQQAAAKAAVSAPAEVAPSPAESLQPDLAMGLTLRDELIAHFAPPKPSEEKDDSSRKVWQDWDGWDSKES